VDLIGVHVHTWTKNAVDSRAFLSHTTIPWRAAALAVVLVASGMAVVGGVVRAPVVLASPSNVLVEPASSGYLLNGVVTSPHGTWQAVSLGSKFLLTQDGSSSQLTSSAPTFPDGFAVGDSGELYALAGSTTAQLEKFSAGSWSTSASFGDAAPVRLTVASSGELIGLLSNGHVFTSTDDGVTWSQRGSMAMPASGVAWRLVTIGNEVYTVGALSVGGVFGRWNVTTGQADTVSAPPALVGSSTAPYLFARPGSTSEIWIAEQPALQTNLGANSGEVWLFRSTDSGNTWSTMVAGDPLPADVQADPFGSAGFQVGTDGRLHVFASATATATCCAPTGMTISEISRGLQTASDWASVQANTLVTDPSGIGGYRAQFFSTQRADGQAPDVISAWTGIPVGSSGNWTDDVWWLRSGTPVPLQSISSFAATGAQVATVSGLRQIVASPSRTWQAGYVTLNGVASIIRSQDGLHWDQIPLPPMTVDISHTSGVPDIYQIAISDLGEVYVDTIATYYIGDFAGTGNEPTSMFRWYQGRWYGPMTFGGPPGCFGSVCNTVPLALTKLANGLWSYDSVGRVFYSQDDGDNWLYGGTIPGQIPDSAQAPPEITANYVHFLVVQQNQISYGRWDRRSHSIATVTTPPGTGGYETFLAPRARSSELWLANVQGSVLSLWKSADEGNTWTEYDTGNPLPLITCSSSSCAFALGADDRLYEYSASTTNGTASVAVSSRSLPATVGASPDWTSAVTVASEPASQGANLRVARDFGAALPTPPDFWLTTDMGSSTMTLYHFGAFGGIPMGGPLTPKERGPGSNLAEPCVACHVPKFGDPVAAPDGTFAHTFGDFAFPGRGPTLGFSRTYNSYTAQNAASHGPLGYGWSDPYMINVAVTGSNPPVATVTQENGAQVNFYPFGPAWVRAAPRIIATLTKNGDGSWKFTRSGGREIFNFDALGRLTSESDLNGNTETLTYNTNGQLTTVTDPEGRTLSFAYYGSGQLLWITDVAGRAVVFTYDNSANLASAIEPDSGKWTFTYDTSHRLLTMLDPNQQSSGSPVPITNHYNAAGQVDWQTDQLGNKTTFTYNLDNTDTGTVTTTDPNHNATQETYSNGLRIAVTTGYGSPQPATTNFAYDLNTLLPVAVQDPNGNTTTYTDDASGNTLSITDPLGRLTTKTYNSLNEPLTVTDPLGNSPGANAANYTTTNTYDASGNLTSASRPCVLADGVTSCDTQTITYHHDQTGNSAGHPDDVTSMTDPRGKTTSYAYSVDGNVSTVTDPLGHTTAYTYDRLGRQISTVAPRGNVTGGTPDNYRSAVLYDARNRPLVSVNEIGVPAIDGFSRSNSSTSLGTTETGRTWTNLAGTWGVSGGKAYLASASGSTNLAVVAGAKDGTVAATETAGQTGVGVAFRVQDANNFWSVRASNASPYVWNLYKTVAGATTPMGSTPSGTCCTGYRVSVTFVSGTITVSVNGVVGLTVTDSTFATATQVGIFATGTGAGRLDDFVTYANPQGFFGPIPPNVDTRSYDLDGNLTSDIDGDGHSTSYSHDLAGQLTQTTQSSPSQVTIFGYDGDGNRTVTVAINPGYQVTSYAYTNPAYPHAVTSVTAPSIGGQPGKTTSSSYDAAGRLTVTTDPSLRTTTNSYDAANQLLSVTYSDGVTPNVSNITYDPDGRRTSLTDGAPPVTSTWTWDSLGQLRSSTIGTAGTVRYWYDLTGNITTIDYPNVGALTRNFDNAGRLSSISDWRTSNNTTSFGYDENNNLTIILYPNNIVSSYTYDSANQIALITDAPFGGSNLASFFYQRTGSGLLASAAPTGTQQPNETYGYDGHGRLSTVNTASYTYDTADDPTQLIDGTQQGFNEANQLCWSGPTSSSCGAPTPMGDTSYTYDAQGNRTSRTPSGGSATNYTYDQANQLTSAPTVSYHYNADNLRTSKGTNYGPQNFTWDVADNTPLLLQQEIVGVVTNFVYGPDDQPIEQITGTTATYLHQDQLGSTRLLTDQTGAVTATYSYNPYGQILTGWKTGTGTTPLQYAGQYTDPETGFSYLRNRYYDPATGQFLTRDPLFAETGSAYAYADDSPLNSTDPTGLFEIPVVHWCVGTCDHDAQPKPDPANLSNCPSPERCRELVSQAQELLGRGHNPARIKEYNEWYQANKKEISQCLHAGFDIPKPRRRNNSLWHGFLHFLTTSPHLPPSDAPPLPFELAVP
jgi:RHS repeat-associated protein